MVIAILAYLVANLYAIYDKTFNPILVFVPTTAIVGWLVLRELSSFWQIGIIGVDRTARQGIPYKTTLDMCTNSLDFLGIGAHKLTSERDAFLAAVKRCNRPARAVRFLLCNPDHPQLQQAERQAGAPARAYQERVTQSLRVLAHARTELAMNVEVRFYHEVPLFRLMLIDDALCIASHYVLGEGDGSQLPQLYVRRSLLGRRDNGFLYYPLKLYFDQLWSESTSWDYKEHLD
jgi:hypothetical protein